MRRSDEEATGKPTARDGAAAWRESECPDPGVGGDLGAGETEEEAAVDRTVWRSVWRLVMSRGLRSWRVLMAMCFRPQTREF